MMAEETPRRRIARPEDAAERMAALHRAGVRHFILDMPGSVETRFEQLEGFAAEGRPLFARMTG